METRKVEMKVNTGKTIPRTVRLMGDGQSDPVLRLSMNIFLDLLSSTTSWIPRAQRRPSEVRREGRGNEGEVRVHDNGKDREEGECRKGE